MHSSGGLYIFIPNPIFKCIAAITIHDVSHSISWHTHGTIQCNSTSAKIFGIFDTKGGDFFFILTFHVSPKAPHT